MVDAPVFRGHLGSVPSLTIGGNLQASVANSPAPLPSVSTLAWRGHLAHLSPFKCGFCTPFPDRLTCCFIHLLRSRLISYHTMPVENKLSTVIPTHSALVMTSRTPASNVLSVRIHSLDILFKYLRTKRAG
jgi:hypothetical protein